MYINSFSVRIPEGKETHSGYVEMQHGKTYTLVLRNARDVRCDARVEVDGKDVGTWRIPAHSSISLERPANDDGKFTFYRLDSQEAKQVGLKDDMYAGLVQVTFTPEKHFISTPIYAKGMCDGSQKRIRGNYYLGDDNSILEGSAAISSSYKAGGTGLSGRSNQVFVDAETIVYDYSQRTTISLRLVINESTPRPLRPLGNEVPPRPLK